MACEQTMAAMTAMARVGYIVPGGAGLKKGFE
jgi:hypothetical protein